VTTEGRTVVVIDSGGAWSPNQNAVRARIAQAAGTLVARDGIAACTVRAVADEAMLTKSTVHNYVRDANELVDLAVRAFLDRLAEQVRSGMQKLPEGPGSLFLLVRMFTNREDRSVGLEDRTLWAAYTAHAFRRGAHDELIACFDIFSELFETAMGRCGVDAPRERARSIYHYLLGATQRHMVQPLSNDEIALAVSALSTLPADLVRLGLEPTRPA
jgi:AcrR family transcriptional regulator